MGTGGTPTIPLFIGQGANGELEGTPGDKPGIGAGDGVMIAGDVRTLARDYCAKGTNGPLRAVRRAQPHLEHPDLAAELDRLDQAALRRPAGAAELFVDRARQPARADSVAGTIKSLFDTGGCNNPDGTAAVKGDGRISPCELSQNPLIKSPLAPDVRLLNEAGKYDPLPDGAQKDSLSLGFGFTATVLT